MSIKIYDLRCENRRNPLGIDTTPRLSWKNIGGQGTTQSAYRVTISSTLENAQNQLGDVFDSGKVQSSDFFCNAPATYQSSTRYFWCVQLFDQNDNASVSETAWFETALLDSALWTGRYLGAPVASAGILLFRRHINAKAEVTRARVYVAAAGFIELYINGNRIGNNVLEPVNSDYEKQLYYVTFDITSALTTGDNVLGIRLNNGWSDHGRFLLQGFMEYADGQRESFVSDPSSFIFAVSGTSIATQYAGEFRNPYNDKPEWCQKGDAFELKYRHESFNILSFWVPDSADTAQPFQKAAIDAYYTAMELPAPKGQLIATIQEPVVLGKEMKPKSFVPIKDGYLFDFGQNFTGVCRLRAKGENGTAITLTHTELLNEDGTPNTVYLRIAEPNYPFEMQTDRYILQGTGEVEEFQPSFTYHGFRFVAVYGLPYPPAEDTLTAFMLNSDIEQIGQFKAEHDMLSWLQEAILWTEIGNLHSIPTDCPQRAERQGWLNDMTARAEGAVYNYDLNLLYSKWTRDIRGTQDDFSGAIGDTAPYRRGNKPADAVCSSYLYAPYLVYTHYGDDRALRENYTGLKGWTEYLYRNSDRGIAIYSLYGDWAGPEPDSYTGSSPVSGITPGQFMSTGFNCFNAQLMAKIAKILGNTQDEKMYTERASFMVGRINEVFYNKDTASYATGSQAANTFALELGIVPAGDEQRVADNINADIIKRDYHLSTGNICTKFLPEILTRYGYIETAMKLMEQTTYPSWGYMRGKGATTIWERWEYATGFAMNSHSHPMYGSITAWFYKYLGGIQVLEPAFRRFSVNPHLPENLPSCSAEVCSPYGKVVSAWNKTQDGYTLHVEVPVSCTAEVTLQNAAEALLSGENPEVCATASNVRFEDGALLLSLASGIYDFTVKS